MKSDKCTLRVSVSNLFAWGCFERQNHLEDPVMSSKFPSGKLGADINFYNFFFGENSEVSTKQTR